MAPVVIILAPKIVYTATCVLFRLIFPALYILAFWVVVVFLVGILLCNASSPISKGVGFQMVSTNRRSAADNHEAKMKENHSISVKNQETTYSSGEAVAENYEEKRAQRMQENMERLKKLGILELSKNLKKTTATVAPKKKKKPAETSLPARNSPPRRSSRLKDMTPVSYAEVRPKEEKTKRIKEINIEEGSKPEVYTEEHGKLLGDSKTPWTLLVDGCDELGQRMYDQYDGKSCHQCRQKTLGHRTKCSKCKSLRGQLCGDCLYTRYGENVIEVKENRDWICPVCRDICNCSRCRRVKGWAPTGAIYPQVRARGFKSVAHFLIQTSRPGTKNEEEGSEMVSANDSFAPSDKIAEISEATMEPNTDVSDTDDEDVLVDLGEDNVSDSEKED